MNSKEYLQKLEDPTYLPSREEIFEQCRKGLSYVFMDKYERSAGKVEYEFVTKELVEWLTNHLMGYANEEKNTILEVCAGNGKLAYHISKALKEKCWDVFTYHAVDNWDDNWKSKLSIVKNMDNSQWLREYNPNIIICSRLPLHPSNMLPAGFQRKFNELSFKDQHYLTDQEQTDYIEMNKVYLLALHWNDITYSWRQNSNVKEYILIWRTSGTWDINKTHWYKKDTYISGSYYDCYSKAEIEALFSDEHALFKQDWFIRKELDIPTMNRMNVMFGFEDQRDNSQIFSFSRVK